FQSGAPPCRGRGGPARDKPARRADPKPARGHELHDNEGPGTTLTGGPGASQTTSSLYSAGRAHSLISSAVGRSSRIRRTASRRRDHAVSTHLSGRVDITN